MNLHKVWLIAKREYTSNFRRRSFLFTAFGVPLITLVMMVLVFSVSDRLDADKGNYRAIGIVDKANVIPVDQSGKPIVAPPAPFVLLTNFQDDAQHTTLRDKIANGEFQGFYVIDSDYVKTGQVETFGREGFPTGLTKAFSDYLSQAGMASVSDPDLSARLQDPLQGKNIYRVDNPSQPLDTVALVGTFILPFAVGFLIFTSTMTTSQFLMAGVADEKENRMMELMITSVRPAEMLSGKILGLGALGMSQLLIWGIISAVFGLARSATDFGRILSDLGVTPGFLALLVVYFVLSYILFGSFMAVIGVLGDNEQEGRQWAGIIVLPAVSPFIFLFLFIADPNGPVPTFLSLFPLTAPVSMVFRLVWGTVTAPQIILSVGLLVISVVAAVWLSARIFRLGMLSYGKRLNLREIVRAIREGRQHIVTTSGGQAKGANA